MATNTGNNRFLSVGSKRTFGLHYHLLTLVAATLLPMLVLGVVAVGWTSRQGQQIAIERLQTTATVLARVVDQGIDNQVVHIRQLAQHTQASQTVPAPALHGPVILPLDQAHAAYHLPDSFLSRLHNGPGTQVSDVFVPPGQRQPWVAIAIDIPGQQAPWILLRPSNQLIALLPQTVDERDRPTSIIALVDSSGHLAARSVEPERWLGKQVPDWEKLNGLGTSNGHLEAVTQEGEKIVFAFQKLAAAPGWALAVGESQAQLRSAWIGPLRGLVSGGVIALVIALLVSQLLSRRILQPLDRLAERSRLIARGHAHPPLPPPSGIDEFELLRTHLQDAETALEQRAADAQTLALALERSQRRYRTVAEAGALVFWEADDTGAMLTTAGWSELTGQPESDALGRGWERSVHPDDLPSIARTWADSIARGIWLDVEFRLRNADGQWHWVRARGAQVGHPGRQEWSGVLEDINLRRQTQDRLVWLAHHDPLTGLHNRACFHDALQKALAGHRDDNSLAVLCLDLDRFKEVNDSLGHGMGDALLCEIAARLKQQVRGEDVVARLGGDEFALLLTRAQVAQAAQALAARIVQAIALPVTVDGHQMAVGVSVGICVATPELATPEALMQAADMALYEAKNQGRGNFHVYTRVLGQRQQLRRKLEVELRQAVDANQIQVRFRPVRSPDDRHLWGWEAGLYWPHPVMGQLQGDDFLELASEIGLMPLLLEQLLAETGRMLPHQEHVQWIIPLRLRELSQAPEQLLSHLPPDATARVWLGFTEGDLAGAVRTKNPLLPWLHRHGYRLAMTEVGTGHSTLSMFQHIDVGLVCLHRRYSQPAAIDASAAPLREALVQFCRQLDLTVLIDGIDTADQLAMLQNLGPDLLVLGNEAGAARQAGEFDDPLHHGID